jgi:hypothetical protein
VGCEGFKILHILGSGASCWQRGACERQGWEDAVGLVCVYLWLTPKTHADLLCRAVLGAHVCAQEYVACALSDRECHRFSVNERLIRCLTVEPPPPDLKLQTLSEIAQVCVSVCVCCECECE